MGFVRWLAPALLVLLLTPAGAQANDRLPPKLRKAYKVALGEVKDYVRYILEKVWKPRLAELRAKGSGAAGLSAEAQTSADDIVHILLPHGEKLVNDVLHGTSETHLRLTMPRRGLMGRRLASAGNSATDVARAAREALETLGGPNERLVHDQLMQALTEDVDDFVSREVETSLGLPAKGRSRRQVRPLSSAFQQPYAERIRQRVQRFSYWWLRKKKRMELGKLAAGNSQKALDEARYTGAIWGLTALASKEAWSMTRLDIDFKWGYPNWEIDRRRIRRRIEQDLSDGTWALSKLVKELGSLRTQKEVEQHLDRRLREELSKGPLKEKAERYPTTAKELGEELDKLRKELDPILDRAMARVKLPEDMAPLAQEHGRRYVHDAMGPKMTGAIRRAAGPIAAARRASEQLPGLVAKALRSFEPGALEPGSKAYRAKAKGHVKREVAPLLNEEIENGLRGAGLDRELESARGRKRAVQEVYKRHGIEEALEKQTARELDAQGAGKGEQ